MPLVRVLNCVPLVDDLGNICGVIRTDYDNYPLLHDKHKKTKNAANGECYD
jgi:hypothetical protein